MVVLFRHAEFLDRVALKNDFTGRVAASASSLPAARRALELGALTRSSCSRAASTVEPIRRQ